MRPWGAGAASGPESCVTLKAPMSSDPMASERDDQAGGSDAEGRNNVRARGEKALAELADAMLDNPLLNQALSTALGAGERAIQAQRSAIGALNLASSADIERIERRLRSLSERLEAVEDRLDDLADELAARRGREREVSGPPGAADDLEAAHQR
jgi:chromosome segregation ATPase